MVRRLAYRGSDGSHVWTEGSVGLVHALLRTTPEGSAHPMAAHRRSQHIHLTADVRIDNREEVLQSLSVDKPSSAISDDAILLAAYKRWGTQLLDKVVGDFAFAIWDDQKKRLFCARDPIGIRPFYFHAGADTFAFASDVSALLGSGIPRDVNDEKVYAFLCGIDHDVEATFYRSINRLLPAHAMVVDRDGERRTWRYWRPEETVIEWQGAHDAEYEEGFRHVFEAAVSSSLRSDKRAGILLSGGIDSSSIACTARHLRAGSVEPELPTFTSIFPSISGHEDLRINESRYVDDVLALGGFEPHFIRADELSPLSGIEKLIAIRGEPVNIRGHYMVAAALEEARGADVDALLDGSEGDIVVGYGYDHFTELARSGRWDEFADLANTYSTNCNQGGRRYEPTKALWDHGLPVMADRAQSLRILQLAADVSLASDTFGVARRNVLATIGREMIRNSGWLRRRRESKLAGAGLVDRDRVLGLSASRLGAHIDAELSPIHARAQPLIVNPTLIEAMESIDPLYFSFGIEARHPFFDRRLMEFCLSLPSAQRLRGGWTRSIVRRALADVLPESLQQRVGKSILSVNMYRNLRAMETERMRETVADDILRPYIARDRAEAAYDRFLETPRTSTARPLFRMAALAIWMHQQRTKPE